MGILKNPVGFDIINYVVEDVVQIYGRVAQLGERLVRNEEVVGSIPITSKIKEPYASRAFEFYVYYDRTTDELRTGAPRSEVSKRGGRREGP